MDWIAALENIKTPLAINSISAVQTTLISDVCFPAGTKVKTDQGIIAIEKINPDIHTMKKRKIVALTKTISDEKYLVLFKKDSLAKNVPCENTLITQKHKIFYKGQMIPAKYFIKDFKDVKKVTYSGEVLYNILLETHEVMMVNNLLAETLHPDNIVAKLFRGEFPEHNEKLNSFLSGKC
jgi:hypothetical protein